MPSTAVLYYILLYGIVLYLMYTIVRLCILTHHTTIPPIPKHWGLPRGFCTSKNKMVPSKKMIPTHPSQAIKASRCSSNCNTAIYDKNQIRSDKVVCPFVCRQYVL